jgi:multidrug resistance efflux pump
LRVARFQKVRVGEELADVLVAEPKLIEASLAVIRAELDTLRARLDPVVAQQRYAVDDTQLRLDWMRRRTELAGARVSRQYAESEWRRTEELFHAKIAAESAVELAYANYQALEKQVEELDHLVSEGQQSLKHLQPPPTPGPAVGPDEPLQAALAAQEARLRLAEVQLSPVPLRAPIDGTVIAVHFRSGEAITPGQVIVTIAADTPTRIVGYVRQPGGVEPKPGETVLVRTRRGSRLAGTAQVLEVGAQLDVLPMALQTSAKFAGAELALPINISLPTTLHLRPGELVDISVLRQPD